MSLLLTAGGAPPVQLPAAPIDPVIWKNRYQGGALDLTVNVAILVIVAAAALPALIEPQITRRAAPQIDSFPNIAVNLQTQTPAGTYLDPVLWKRPPAQPDLPSNIAVEFQTIVPAGFYLDPVRYPRPPSAPDLYPNLAVNLQTVMTWPGPEPVLWKRVIQPDLFPNIAATLALPTYRPPPFVEQPLIRRTALPIDLAPNIAALTTPPAQVLILPMIDPIPPKRYAYQIDYFPNIAVNFPVTPTVTKLHEIGPGFNLLRLGGRVGSN